MFLNLQSHLQQLSFTQIQCCCFMGYSLRFAERYFYMHHPTDRIVHTTAFVTPVMEQLVEKEITGHPVIGKEGTKYFI